MRSGRRELNRALRQAHQWVTFATSTPFQEATAVGAGAGGDQWLLPAAARRVRRAARCCCASILEAAGLPTLPVEGSYFISTDISALGYTDDRRILPLPDHRDRRGGHSDLGILQRPGVGAAVRALLLRQKACDAAGRRRAAPAPYGKSLSSCFDIGLVSLRQHGNSLFLAVLCFALCERKTQHRRIRKVPLCRLC